jgi:hypothetical protein
MESLQFSTNSSLDISLSSLQSLDLDEEPTPPPKEPQKSLLDSGPYENISPIVTTTNPLSVHHSHNNTSYEQLQQTTISSSNSYSNTSADDDLDDEESYPLISCHLWGKRLTSLPPALYQLTQVIASPVAL